MAKRSADGDAENPKTKQQVEHKEGTLRALFDTTSLVSFHTLRNKVVTIDVSDKPLDAFKKIIESKVLSAPVWDPKASKFIGFLDVRDLVSYVVMSYDYRAKQKEASDSKSAAKHTKKASLGKDGDWKFSKEAQEFLESVLVESWAGPTVRPGNPMDTLTVRYLCGRNRFVPVESKATLTDVARVLANKDVHRVPVADNDNKLLDIISQSTIVDFIQKNASKLQDQLGQTIDKLGLARKEVVTVKAKESTINAFRVLNSKNLYGLAVVDDEGKVIANTSSSDMKLFVAAPSFELLEMPVLEYLNIIRRASLKEGIPVVCVTPHDTLGKCIGKLAATKMHRIFVVDDHHKPIGVVSLRDIINACMHL